MQVLFWWIRMLKKGGTERGPTNKKRLKWKMVTTDAEKTGIQEGGNGGKRVKERSCGDLTLICVFNRLPGFPHLNSRKEKDADSRIRKGSVIAALPRAIYKLCCCYD